MTIDLDLGRRVLAAQSFSRLLGTRIVGLTDTSVVLELDADERMLQQNGFVHGGVLSYLADNVLTMAGALALGEQVLTASVSLDYLRPASPGLLQATATVIAATGRTAACRAEIVGAGVVCAVGHGTVRKVVR